MQCMCTKYIIQTPRFVQRNTSLKFSLPKSTPRPCFLPTSFSTVSSTLTVSVLLHLAGLGGVALLPGLLGRMRASASCDMKICGSRSVEICQTSDFRPKDTQPTLSLFDHLCKMQLDSASRFQEVVRPQFESCSELILCFVSLDLLSFHD